jgi:hypothetical protein
METPDERAQRLTSIVAALTAGVNARWDQVVAQPELELGVLEAAAQQVSRTVFGAVVGAALEVRRSAVEAAARCPHCEAVPQDKGVQQRTQETLVGPVSWGRRSMWCDHCRQGWYPRDAAWGIVPGQCSDRLQAAICRLGASVPFAAAAETLTALTGVVLGVRTVERLTEARGQALEAVRTADWAALCDGHTPVPPVPLRPESGVWAMALDAARLRIDAGWHEAKAGVVGWVPADGTRHTVALSYLSVVGSLEATGDRLELEARQRGCDPVRDRVVCLADGAPGNWLQLAAHFPDRVEVLDWWHAVEQLWAAGNGVFGEGSAAAARWVAARKARLWDGRVDLVLRALRQAARQPHGAAATAELPYFTTNASRMDYAAFRAAGYPIASGMVESACKRVIGARTKQAGMQWTRPGAQAVLSLRAELLSDRWDDVWPLTRAA